MTVQPQPSQPQPSQPQTASPVRASTDAQSLDLEKSYTLSGYSDSSTIRVPFSTRKPSRKLFFTVLIFGNILFIALVVGLAVGLTTQLHNSSTSAPKPGSSDTAMTGNHQNGGGAGPNRHS
ncbi:hypothetical protein DRE_00489 [Drechslerella stenobrocha 248]|uniref:Uncharacterized protein n=1 Tax=Drechslerella stenobrocha 248 TaxID=1043628 RepID=W7HTQ8_9PEZI|nr:hypothetical protein DRE_00489 [Drechslerella stenobrocha 248]